MMTSEVARKQFIAKTGARKVSGEAFASIFTELTERKSRGGEGFREDDALSLLCEWYEVALRLRETHSPLTVVETFRRPRVWATFLAWEQGK
jgi:hypothetical protein